MKKIFLTLNFLLLALALTGCGKQVMMDELDQQGFYPYSNDLLGFNLPLPEEFKYYQTQRVSFTDHTDLDIFVPTADTSYGEQVPGYAEPIIVRVYDKTAYDALNTTTLATMVKVAEKGDKVYSLVFWFSAPSDWQGKWSDAMKQQLIKNFSLK